MIYPPPNAEDVVQARFCSAMKRLVLFTARNNFMFYRLEKKVSVLEKTIFPEMLKDTEGNSIIYKINCFEIGSNEVPAVDHRDH